MKKNLKNIFLLVLFLLCLLGLTACGKPSIEKVKTKMEKELYEEYGEEFVVENIGLRTANGEKFYQAKIYPKSIIGTPKEDDDYYYSTASVDLKRFNKANSVGNSYGTIKMNDEAEEYLLPKAKELFGERIRLKADVEYKIKDGDFFTQYLVAGFEEKRKESLKNPDTQRFELTLYLYLFDKIDSEEEKEERRKQIFEFIKYLKVEGLFEYIQLDVCIVDERILTKGYTKFRNRQNFISENTYIEKYDIYMKIVPYSIRKLIANELNIELKELTSQDLIENMMKIQKKDLGEKDWEGFIGDSIQYYSRIESIGKLKLNNDYQNLTDKDKIKVRYEEIENIKFIDLFHKYIFFKEESR